MWVPGGSHSEKGEQALAGLPLKRRTVDVHAAVKQNICAVKASPEHPNRERFLADLDTMPFAQAVKTWLPRKVSHKERVAQVLEKLGLLELVRKVLGKK